MLIKTSNINPNSKSTAAVHGKKEVPNKKNILAAAQSANSNISGLPKMVGTPGQC
ncbi:MAG: hypothetical protein ACI8PW_000227 [Methylophilaceae bacterium]|jgi:hypothetical protein